MARLSRWNVIGRSPYTIRKASQCDVVVVNARGMLPSPSPRLEGEGKLPSVVFGIDDYLTLSPPIPTAVATGRDETDNDDDSDDDDSDENMHLDYLLMNSKGDTGVDRKISSHTCGPLSPKKKKQINDSTR
jgi:hypothetical protein